MLRQILNRVSGATRRRGGAGRVSGTTSSGTGRNSPEGEVARGAAQAAKGLLRKRRR